MMITASSPGDCAAWIAATPARQVRLRARYGTAGLPLDEDAARTQRAHKGRDQMISYFELKLSQVQRSGPGGTQRWYNFMRSETQDPHQRKHSARRERRLVCLIQVAGESRRGLPGEEDSSGGQSYESTDAYSLVRILQEVRRSQQGSRFDAVRAVPRWLSPNDRRRDSLKLARHSATQKRWQKYLEGSIRGGGPVLKHPHPNDFGRLPSIASETR